MIKTIKYFAFLSLISICIVLGFWQIDRGNEKKDIYNSFTENLSKNPLDFSLLDKRPNQFTNTVIKKSSYSYLSDKQFLLDNKVNNRQAGYEVITPVLVNKEILLVNRGWITNHSRLKLPSINIIDGKVIHRTNNLTDEVAILSFGKKNCKFLLPDLILTSTISK